MTTEWIDIVDTVVKIGLGAGISAFAGFQITKHNSVKAMEKEKNERRLAGIEHIIINTDHYFDALEDFFSLTGGILKTFPDKSYLDMDNPQDLRIFEQLKECDVTLVSTRKHIVFSKSRLKLLGLDEAYVSIGKLTTLESQIRTSLLFDYKIPSKAKLSEIRRDFAKLRSVFHEQLRVAYDL